MMDVRNCVNLLIRKGEDLSGSSMYLEKIKRKMAKNPF
jgi:hypothetical protein